MLLALDDGRALPASRMAEAAGVSAATASSHLKRLTDAGLLTVEQHGRFRYYRLAGPAVGRLVELVGQLAPAAPVTSLKQHTRARTLRRARTCYDHLAGSLGVALMGAFLDRDLLTGGTGAFHPGSAQHDRLSAPGVDLDYRLTETGREFIVDFGVQLPSRRREVGYCIDWTEQRHHLAGALGRGLRDRLLALDWIRRADTSRALRITDIGRRGLREVFSVDVAD